MSDQTFSAVDQQYWRRTTLSSVDLSYDAGFATLSSTSTYAATNGWTMSDGTYVIGTINAFNVNNYYAGNPLNPRYVEPGLFTDYTHTFDQELRLVSKTGPDAMFDYVVGLFYEDQTASADGSIPSPGSYERAVAARLHRVNTIAGDEFPELPALGGTGRRELHSGRHPALHGQIRIRRAHLALHAARARSPSAAGISSSSLPTRSRTWSIRTASWSPPRRTAHRHRRTPGRSIPPTSTAPDQYVYAIWSQGFRRGGANSVPSMGIYKESPLLKSYAPDSVNNYEAGLKGRFSNGLSYTFAVFDIHWDKPQISSTLPDGNLGGLSTAIPPSRRDLSSNQEDRCSSPD